ncbi:aminotransferase class V-fold PLP-dependent enzyme [Microbacterium oxydans]|nr:aminotransferase class V-fold PLP-dependent enzyme [Microbacterium oxydans]
MRRTAKASSVARSSPRSSATPSNAAAAKAAGYEVITVYPDAEGYPSLDALKAALSPRTAAIMVTNPEDTGIYNPAIREWVDAAHAVGALASYDQANANGILGVTRARDAGFDVCHFNLHKTFGTPHGSGGPGSGANAVSAALAPFLPGPRVVRADDGTFGVVEAGELSIGAVGPFFGVIPALVKAYSWIMALGAPGLLAAAETAVLNNNYLMARVLAIPGASAPYATGSPPHRAGALLVGGAVPGDRHLVGGDRRADVRLRDALLDESPPLRGAAAVHARAHRVVLHGGAR